MVTLENSYFYYKIFLCIYNLITLYSHRFTEIETITYL